MSSPRTVELDELERGASTHRPRHHFESEDSGADLGVQRHHRRRTLSESSSDSARRHRKSTSCFADLPGYHDHEPGAPHDPNHQSPPHGFTYPASYFTRVAGSFCRAWHKVGVFFHQDFRVSWIHLAILAFFAIFLLMTLVLTALSLLLFGRQQGTVITVSPHLHFQGPSYYHPQVLSTPPTLPPTVPSSTFSSIPTSRPVKTIIATSTHTAHEVKTVVNQPTIIVDESGHTLQAPTSTARPNTPIVLRVGETDVAKHKEVILSIIGRNDNDPEPTTAPGGGVTMHIVDDEVHANATIMVVVVGDHKSTSTRDGGSAVVTATKIKLLHGDVVGSV
jgi:hypothetical protein